jgi:hypothetical protein
VRVNQDPTSRLANAGISPPSIVQATTDAASSPADARRIRTADQAAIKVVGHHLGVAREPAESAGRGSWKGRQQLIHSPP